MGDRRGEADSLINLGAVHHELGRYDAARDCFERSLTVLRQIGAGYSEAEALRRYALTLHAQGQTADARRHWQAALAIYDQLGSPLAGDVRAMLTGEPAVKG